MSYSDLHDAITAGDCETVTSAMTSALDMNAVYRQETPLTRAIQCEKDEIISAILSSPAVDINVGNQFDRTPLYFASKSGNISLVKLLLSRGADVDQPDIEGITPLGATAWYNRYEVTKALILSGANINAVNKRDESALYRAVENTSYDVVKVLLQNGCDANIASKYKNQTPLMAAVRRINLSIDHRKSISMPKSVGIVNQLIEYGVDLNARDEDGNTALHLAVEFENIHAVILLLHHNCDVHTKNNNFVTPLELSLSSTKCKYEIAQFICLYKCMRNFIANDKYFTEILSSLTASNPCPLSSGRLQKEISVTSMLLDEAFMNDIQHLIVHVGRMSESDIRNCNIVNMLNQYFIEKVPKSLQVVCRNSIRESLNTLVIEKVRQLPIALSQKRYLLYGYDLEKCPPMDVSNIHLAAESGDIKALDEFVKLASIDSILSYQTPLLQAIRNDHGDCVELLLKRGADQSIPDGEGNYPIHIATEVGNEKILRTLLSFESACTLTLKNSEGNLPLHVACINGNFNSALILIEYGAVVDIPDIHGRYPLHYASASGDVTSVNAILRSSLNVNVVDKEGYSALHLAVTRGNLYLQKNIALPFMFTSKLAMELTITSMMYSLNKRVKSYPPGIDHPEVVRLLIQNGCDVNQESSEGKDAAELADHFGMTDIAAIVNAM